MIEMTEGMALAVIGAGIAIGSSAWAVSMGVGICGAAGCGVIGEHPDKFPKILVLEFIPGTQGVYGLLAGLLILLTVGLLGGTPKPISTFMGLAVIGAALSPAIAEHSSYWQGVTALAGIGAIVKKPEDFGRCVVMAVMSETYALFGLLGTVVILFALGLFG